LKADQLRDLRCICPTNRFVHHGLTDTAKGG
jgi:hypothetical protein